MTWHPKNGPRLVVDLEVVSRIHLPAMKKTTITASLLAVVAVFPALPSAMEWEDQGLCPVTVEECLPVDNLEALEHAHLLDSYCRPLERWERDAIEIITADFHRQLHHLNPPPPDCGSFGLFHFQPSDPLRVGADTKVECPWGVQWWQDRIADAIYSPYSATLQLRAWRRIIGPAAWASPPGFPKVVIAAVANSTGAHHALEMAESCGWEPECLVRAYVEERPGSRHREHRARRLLRYLRGLDP